ncbi:MAG: flagellar biosynthetic protein FliO [Fimbriimonadaceae bacterium]
MTAGLSRAFAIASVGLAAAAVWAQDADLGTKADPNPGFSSAAQGQPIGFAPLLQLALAVAVVVLLLKLVLPKLVSKLNRGLVAGVGSPIRIEEAAQFAGGTLVVVEARNRTLLLCVGGNGVTMLADLTPAPSATPAEETLTFGEMVEKATQGPPAAPIRIAVSPSPTAPSPQPEPADGPTESTDPDEAEEVLRRLASLSRRARRTA